MHLTNAIWNAQFSVAKFTVAHYTVADFTDPTKKWLPNFPVAQFSVAHFTAARFTVYRNQGSRIRSIRILFFEGYVRTLT